MEIYAVNVGTNGVYTTDLRSNGKTTIENCILDTCAIVEGTAISVSRKVKIKNVEILNSQGGGINCRTYCDVKVDGLVIDGVKSTGIAINDDFEGANITLSNVEQYNVAIKGEAEASFTDCVFGKSKKTNVVCTKNTTLNLVNVQVEGASEEGVIAVQCSAGSTLNMLGNDNVISGSTRTGVCLLEGATLNMEGGKIIDNHGDVSETLKIDVNNVTITNKDGLNVKIKRGADHSGVLLDNHASGLKIQSNTSGSLAFVGNGYVGSSYVYNNKGATLTLKDPPYVFYGERCGRVQRQRPGTFLNTAVYNHAASFKVYADVAREDYDDALDTFLRALPNHPDNSDSCRTSEPYCVGNVYYGPHNERYGMNLFSWFTATPAWLIHGGYEQILGVKAGFDGIEITPHVPVDWENYSVNKLYRGTKYEIEFARSSEEKGIWVDGVKIAGNCVKSDKGSCKVLVKF